jgi:hypothetical protein
MMQIVPWYSALIVLSSCIVARTTQYVTKEKRGRDMNGTHPQEVQGKHMSLNNLTIRTTLIH